MMMLTDSVLPITPTVRRFLGVAGVVWAVAAVTQLDPDGRLFLDWALPPLCLLIAAGTITVALRPRYGAIAAATAAASPLAPLARAVLLIVASRRGAEHEAIRVRVAWLVLVAVLAHGVWLLILEAPRHRHRTTTAPVTT